MKASITKHEKLGVIQANFGHKPIFKGRKEDSESSPLYHVLGSLILK